MPVSAITIKHRDVYGGGQEFGEFGQFERLDCKANYQIDPKSPTFSRITDLHLVPPNAEGLVEFSGDLTIVKPDSTSPRYVLVDIPNRGRMVSFSSFNRPKPSEIIADACAAGDGILFNHGFAVASIGWQFDAQGMAMNLPHAKIDGQPIRGQVVCQMQIGRNSNSLYMGQGGEMTYEVSGLARLYVCNHTQAPQQLIDDDQWKFGRVKDGEFVSTNSFITLDGGFSAGKH